MTPFCYGVFILLFICYLNVIEGKKIHCVMDGKNGKGTINGTIILEEKDKKVTISYDLEGIMPQNTRHGFTIHEEGKLGNDCEDAGAHFNPEKKVHGSKGDEERHLGDLGNIEATSGKANSRIIDDKISLYGDHSVIGKSIVIYEGVDDEGDGGHFSSDTTGNAGSRQQCCVIVASTTSTTAISTFSSCFISIALYIAIF